MSNNSKISIRFFDDREVRAVWDGESNKWWFSVLDVVTVLNRQDNYNKVRNYWKYLKAKLKKEGSELVSATTQLKLRSPDGKMRLTDTIDSPPSPSRKTNRACLASTSMLTYSVLIDTKFV